MVATSVAVAVVKFSMVSVLLYTVSLVAWLVVAMRLYFAVFLVTLAVNKTPLVEYCVATVTVLLAEATAVVVVGVSLPVPLPVAVANTLTVAKIARAMVRIAFII